VHGHIIYIYIYDDVCAHVGMACACAGQVVRKVGVHVGTKNSYVLLLFHPCYGVDMCWTLVAEEPHRSTIPS
jgi:hypothetical protein